MNATCLSDRPSGAKQRFVGIYGALFRSLPDVEFVIFEPYDCRVLGWFDRFDNVSARATPIQSLGRFRKYFTGVRYWDRVSRQEQFELFEAMHLPFQGPLAGKKVLTLHDVRGLNSETSELNRRIFASVLRRALQKADHVVTVSAAMRSEILEFYPHTQVSVIHNGFDAEVFASITQSECKVFLARYKLPHHFALAVGHFERRKNYRRLIEAVGLLKRRGRECPLVIIGNDSGDRAALSHMISKEGLGNQVTLLSGISDQDVLCAYLTCGLFVFPSYYEGFGIPLLEAMAAKRPMVLSDLDVFKEITEHNMVYFPPNDVEAMADAIETGFMSTETRIRMMEYGVRRVADFSFLRLAKKMQGVYDHLL